MRVFSRIPQDPPPPGISILPENALALWLTKPAKYAARTEAEENRDAKDTTKPTEPQISADAL